MSNMSYCRFENTLNDVDDCIDALNHREITSTRELSCAKALLSRVLKFCYNEGIIDRYDNVTLDEVVNNCKETDDEE